jgi:hypothetical protein
MDELILLVREGCNAGQNMGLVSVLAVSLWLRWSHRETEAGMDGQRRVGHATERVCEGRGQPRSINRSHRRPDQSELLNSV